ncbi:hypothetical protein [Paenibacillus donghaensis]|uniref:Uncharacterized protein n=1 Tax=Paenibacillus donghaensis TaxID=414771 RepID=A0A2Z2KF45_9BACL|nr:hypothetical protein [Paenibacillus donghaensis]ASA22575.1 hypothetical protein B9T62_18370 [Paenibacillus donghaensis]
MKIKQLVREQYQELCPYSAHKCDTYDQIDFKIKRAVETGRVTNTYPYRIVQYHNLQFVVSGDTVVNMSKNSDYAYVSEDRKQSYERKFYKIVV